MSRSDDDADRAVSHGVIGTFHSRMKRRVATRESRFRATQRCAYSLYRQGMIAFLGASSIAIGLSWFLGSESRSLSSLDRRGSSDAAPRLRGMGRAMALVVPHDMESPMPAPLTLAHLCAQHAAINAKHDQAWADAAPLHVGSWRYDGSHPGQVRYTTVVTRSL